MIILISFQIYKLESQLEAPKLKSQYLKPERMKWDYFKVSCPAHVLHEGLHMGQNREQLLQFSGEVCIYSESWRGGGWKQWNKSTRS